MNTDIFEDLFVLEMTNNHLGRLDRGLRIVQQFAKIVRFNNVRAAIKLQFRDIDSFIHKDFVDRQDIRYVRRVTETRMSKADYARIEPVWQTFKLTGSERRLGCSPQPRSIARPPRRSANTASFARTASSNRSALN